MIEIKIDGTLAHFDGVFRNVNEAMEDFARAIVALRCLAEKKAYLTRIILFAKCPKLYAVERWAKPSPI